MRDGDNLSSHIVVESVDRVGVNEAVTHPETCPHHLLHLTHHLRERRRNKIKIEKYLLLSINQTTKNVNVKNKNSLNPDFPP